MPTTILTGTILAGQSLSDAIDCTAGTPVFVVGPAAWTPANLSFQLSADGIAFGDWFTWDGKELIKPFLAGTAWIVLTDVLGTKGVHVKVRSGSRDHPVIQEADRIFQFVVAS